MLPARVGCGDRDGANCDITACCMADEHNQITYHEWGKEKQVDLWLDNRPDPPADKNLLEQIFDKVDLPECQLYLIIDKMNSFPDKRGFCVFWEDRKYAFPPCYMEDVQRSIGTDVLEGTPRWNYLVYIPERTARRWKRFESYFALCLWHELEHTRVMAEDLQLHRFASWLEEEKRYCRLFGQRGSRFYKAIYKRPLELYCYKEGKRLTVEEYRGKYVEDFEGLANKEFSPTFCGLLNFLRDLDCDSEVGTDFIKQRIKNDITHAGKRDIIFQELANEKEKERDGFAQVVEWPPFL